MFNCQVSRIVAFTPSVVIVNHDEPLSNHPDEAAVSVALIVIFFGANPIGIRVSTCGVVDITVNVPEAYESHADVTE